MGGSGFPLHHVLSDNVDEFTCKICSEFCEQPVVTLCKNKHIFCLACLGRMVSKRCEMSDVPRTHGVRDGREVRNLERTLAGFISRVRESTRAVSDGRCVRLDRLVFGDYETHDIHGFA